MKKALTSALVLTFAVVLSFVLVTGTQAESSLTIFETLRDQDGAQGFIAVVRLAEERCPRFSRLLDRARASLVVLVPQVRLWHHAGDRGKWRPDSIGSSR